MAKRYIVDRSIDCFLVYPEDDMSQAQLCEDIQALWEFVAQCDEDDMYGLTEEAASLIYIMQREFI